MSGIYPVEVAKTLWEVAHGTPPTGGTEWSKFLDAVTEALNAQKTYTLGQAHMAVYSYSPINPEGMVPLYRMAYEATVKGCAESVLKLKDKG